MDSFEIERKDRVCDLMREVIALADKSIQNGKPANAAPVNQIIHKLAEAIELLAA